MKKKTVLMFEKKHAKYVDSDREKGRQILESTVSES